MTLSIELQSINYKIKNKQLLHNVSLTIEEGKVTGILGPNGAGKTTLFYILAGLIKQFSGNIKIGGNNITKLLPSDLLNAGIAFLPQNSSIFQKLTVEENILSGLDYSKTKLSHKVKQQKLYKVMSDLQINSIKNTKGINLSGGERRRVEIARCLIMQPKFILLDEPFAGIDPITIKNTKIILENISKTGTGIFISDHNAPDTLDLCDWIYILYNGAILNQGNAQTIQNDDLVKNLYLGH